MTDKWNEPLLVVIREQGECPFRAKGAGSKSHDSQGSRDHENCNQGAESTFFVRKKAARKSKSKPYANQLISKEDLYRYILHNKVQILSSRSIASSPIFNNIFIRSTFPAKIYWIEKEEVGLDIGILESLEPGPGLWTRKCWCFWIGRSVHSPAFSGSTVQAQGPAIPECRKKSKRSRHQEKASVSSPRKKK